MREENPTEMLSNINALIKYIINIDTKQAVVPSSVFGVLNNFFLPQSDPIIAAFKYLFLVDFK